MAPFPRLISVSLYSSTTVENLSGTTGWNLSYMNRVFPTFTLPSGMVSVPVTRRMSRISYTGFPPLTTVYDTLPEPVSRFTVSFPFGERSVVALGAASAAAAVSAAARMQERTLFIVSAK